MRVRIPKKGKAKIKIEPHDTWSLDHTLSLIILPALQQLKATTHGSPIVENEDVPENLRKPADMDEFDLDDHWHARWNYVLDEMIWAFKKIKKTNWSFHSQREEERIANGLRLFGKYYRGLWD